MEINPFKKLDENKNPFVIGNLNMESDEDKVSSIQTSNIKDRKPIPKDLNTKSNREKNVFATFIQNEIGKGNLDLYKDVFQHSDLYAKSLYNETLSTEDANKKNKLTINNIDYEVEPENIAKQLNFFDNEQLVSILNDDQLLKLSKGNINVNDLDIDQLEQISVLNTIPYNINKKTTSYEKIYNDGEIPEGYIDVGVSQIKQRKNPLTYEEYELYRKYKSLIFETVKDNPSLSFSHFNAYFDENIEEGAWDAFAKWNTMNPLEQKEFLSPFAMDFKIANSIDPSIDKQTYDKFQIYMMDGNQDDSINTFNLQRFNRKFLEQVVPADFMNKIGLYPIGEAVTPTDAVSDSAGYYTGLGADIFATTSLFVLSGGTTTTVARSAKGSPLFRQITLGNGQVKSVPILRETLKNSQYGAYGRVPQFRNFMNNLKINNPAGHRFLSNFIGGTTIFSLMNQPNKPFIEDKEYINQEHWANNQSRGQIFLQDAKWSLIFSGLNSASVALKAKVPQSFGGFRKAPELSVKNVKTTNDPFIEKTLKNAGLPTERAEYILKYGDKATFLQRVNPEALVDLTLAGGLYTYIYGDSINNGFNSGDAHFSAGLMSVLFLIGQRAEVAFTKNNTKEWINSQHRNYIDQKKLQIHQNKNLPESEIIKQVSELNSRLKVAERSTDLIVNRLFGKTEFTIQPNMSVTGKEVKVNLSTEAGRAELLLNHKLFNPVDKLTKPFDARTGIPTSSSTVSEGANMIVASDDMLNEQVYYAKLFGGRPSTPVRTGKGNQNIVARIYNKFNKKPKVIETPEINLPKQTYSTPELTPSINIGDKVSIKLPNGKVLTGKYNEVQRKNREGKVPTIGGKEVTGILPTDQGGLNQEIKNDNIKLISNTTQGVSIKNNTISFKQTTELIPTRESQFKVKEYEKIINEMYPANPKIEGAYGYSLNPNLTKFNDAVFKQQNKTDIVSIDSINVPRSQLEDTNIIKDFIVKNKDLIKENTNFGLYKLDNKYEIYPEEMVSIDFNVAIPREFRENSEFYLKVAGQESGYDIIKQDVFGKSGNSGLSPVVFSKEQKAELIEQLSNGKSPEFLSELNTKTKDIEPDLFIPDPNNPIVEQAKRDIISDPTSSKETAKNLRESSDVPWESIYESGQKLLKEFEKLETNQEIMVAGVNKYDKELTLVDRFHQYITANIRKNGQMYRYRNLLDVTDDAFGMIYNAPEFAMLNIAEELRALNKKYTLNEKELIQVTKAYEAKSITGLNSSQVAWYKAMEVYFKDVIEAKAFQEGLISKTWEERQTEKLEFLQAELKLAQRSNKINRIKQEIQFIKNTQQYLPHSIVAQKLLYSKYNGLRGQRKKRFASNLETFFKERKGKPSLADYVKAEILKPNEILPQRLLIDAYSDIMQRVAILNFVDFAKQDNLIVPKNEQMFFEDNYIDGDLLPMSKALGGLDDFKVHKIAEMALKEVYKVGVSKGAWYNKIMGSIKMSQFITPHIILVYDVLQAVYSGAFVANPIKQSRIIAQAMKSVISKDDLYKEALLNNIFQKQDVAQIKEKNFKLDNIYKQTVGSDTFKQQSVSLLENMLGVSKENLKSMIESKDFLQLISTAFMSPAQVLAYWTWKGDEMIRMMSYLSYKEGAIGIGGTPLTNKEAAASTSRAHGAYANIARKFIDIARNIFFVYSFRILMPIQYVIKPYYVPFREMIYKFSGSKKFSDKKLKQALWTLFAKYTITTSLDAYMKMKGYELDESEEESLSGKMPKIDWNFLGIDAETRFFLPPVKYTKDVQFEIDGKPQTRELVISINNIVNQPTKWINRLTYRDPSDLTDESGERWLDFIRYEVHPFWGNSWKLMDNEPFEFGDVPPRGISGDEWGKGTKEWFLNTYKTWKAILEQGQKAVEQGDLTKGEWKSLRKQYEEELEKELSFGEKALKAMSFQYTRQGGKDERNQKAIKRLVNEYKSLVYKLQYLDINDKEYNKEFDKLYEKFDKQLDTLNKRLKD